MLGHTKETWCTLLGVAKESAYLEVCLALRVYIDRRNIVGSAVVGNDGWDVQELLARAMEEGILRSDMGQRTLARAAIGRHSAIS